MTSMVVCPEPLAAAVGAAILRSGGNAVDAAIATAFAQGVTNPLACGIGGFALLHIYEPVTQRGTTLHGSATIGSGTVPEEFRSGYLGRAEMVGRHIVKDDLNQYGHSSVLVPGFVAAAGAAFERFGSGRVAWPALLEPAIELARDGFPVYPYIEKYQWFGGADRPGYPDATRKLTAPLGAGEIYLRDGRYYRTGELMRQSEYGRTLQRLASDGAADFYEGAIASQIVSDFSSRGGFLTAEDLRTYQVLVGEPLVGSYRGFTVMTSPAPSQGAQILHMLNLLEAFDLRTLPWNGPAYVELLSKAMFTAFSDSAASLGDLNVTDVPIAVLISKEYARAQSLLLTRPIPADVGTGPTPPAHTTHATIVDRDGRIAAITHSIGSVAGAGFVTPGLGFLYNNLLGHFSPLPGRPDSIAPKKRMDGGAPTIVALEGMPVLAIGSSGGSRLISAIVQTLINVIDFDMPIQQAVSAPRFHSERLGVLAIEAEIVADIGDELRQRGFALDVTQYLGCNQAVLIDRASGTYFAGTDPRGGHGVGVSFDFD